MGEVPGCRVAWWGRVYQNERKDPLLGCGRRSEGVLDDDGSGFAA